MLGAIRGWSNRLVGSLWGVFFGVCIFTLAVFLLFTNEGRENPARIAAIATPAVESVEGVPVFAEGVLRADEAIGDEYIALGPYAALTRKVEVYAWQEEKVTSSSVGEDGQSKTDVTYSYEAGWADDAPDSSQFNVPGGHRNLAATISDRDFRADELFVDDISIDVDKVTLPTLSPLVLDEDLLRPAGLERRVNDQYLYIGTSDIANPSIGDMRISYRALPLGEPAVIFGVKGSRDTIDPYDRDGLELYRVFLGTKEDGVRRLSQEYTASRYALRFFGFLLVWLGLYLLFAPIRALLSIVPVVGRLTRGVVGVLSFFGAVVIVPFVMVAAFVWRSPIIFAILLTVFVGLLIWLWQRYLVKRVDN